MGFPTANVEVDGSLCVPADGVYGGYVLVGNAAWPAAVNVGLPPTFEHAPGSAHLEANLLGFKGDLYGADVKVLFAEWLRPSRKFDSLDELIATVNGNIAYIRETYGEEPRMCRL